MFHTYFIIIKKVNVKIPLVDHHLLEMFSIVKIKLRENNSMNVSDIYHLDMNINTKTTKFFVASSIMY